MTQSERWQRMSAVEAAVSGRCTWCPRVWRPGQVLPCHARWWMPPRAIRARERSKGVFIVAAEPSEAAMRALPIALAPLRIPSEQPVDAPVPCRGGEWGHRGGVGRLLPKRCSLALAAIGGKEQVFCVTGTAEQGKHLESSDISWCRREPFRRLQGTSRTCDTCDCWHGACKTGFHA